MSSSKSAGGRDQGLSETSPAVSGKRSIAADVLTQEQINVSENVTANERISDIKENDNLPTSTLCFSDSFVTENQNRKRTIATAAAALSGEEDFCSASQSTQSSIEIQRKRRCLVGGCNFEKSSISIDEDPGDRDINTTTTTAIATNHLLERNLQRLRALKKLHLENVFSYFYIRNRNSIMDEYSIWRTQSISAELQNFLDANDLESSENKKNSNITANITYTECETNDNKNDIKILIASNANAIETNEKVPNLDVEHGFTINIKTEISATPETETTTDNVPEILELHPQFGQTEKTISKSELPKSVVIPRTDCINSGTAMTFASVMKRSPHPSVNTSPMQSFTSSINANMSSPYFPENCLAADHAALPKEKLNLPEFSYKAKQEVYVMKRINELQREGLWSEKRLPKLQEPSRCKMHWDYLLEEMVWMSSDFAGERKLKKAAAKKCAKMIQKYFHDKNTAAQKAEKAREIHIRRLAAFLAKEVRLFWSNVEKFVEYKNQARIEETRKKALDQHLNFIVDQTEKFSQQLAEGMNKSLQESNLEINNTPSLKHASDDEFRPDSPSEDDEETIAKEEEDDEGDVNAEIKALEKEATIPLDEFLHDLPPGYLENRGNISSISNDSLPANEANTDFTKDNSPKPSKVDSGKYQMRKLRDDENTLRNESSSTKALEPFVEKTRKSPLDSDDEPFSDTETEYETGSADNYSDSFSDASDAKEAELKNLFVDDTNVKDDLKDAAAIAERLQPKGNTLSSTKVVTPIPFLLKHTLREYQHIGLDWLVTMNEQKLNGILADEMGLGKTIQTIALLAHLACVKNNWGPHLIVVPSSVMLNWEMEFKKWCPAFKILTYYGSQKERKLKRIGWTKPNAFHVCITSYKLVVQDQQAFRRKKWKYLILDEAQNIKNFKSQRWQLLQNFSTERRLLLTGTPLQNDLMELWSLMHFLMPSVFRSHREFQEWFSNPMSVMIEENMEFNESLVNRLHQVIRPFLLRRLKKEVEKQMPKKYEHIINCRLSNRQRYLYDDFMSNSKTRETLESGNSRSVINVLMQLRKVCNHPNMFEMRPILSPFQMEPIMFEAPRIVLNLFERKLLVQAVLSTLNLLLIELEISLSAYASYKSRILMPPNKLIEEIDNSPISAPRCPTGKYRFHVRVRDVTVYNKLQSISTDIVKIGASPAMKEEGNRLLPVERARKTLITTRIGNIINPIRPISSMPTSIRTKRPGSPLDRAQLKCSKIDKPLLQSSSHSEVNLTSDPPATSKPINSNQIEHALAQKVRSITKATTANEEKCNDTKCYSGAEDDIKLLEHERKNVRLSYLKRMAKNNQRRLEAVPIYGSDCRDSIRKFSEPTHIAEYSTWQIRGYTNCLTAMKNRNNQWALNKMLKSNELRLSELDYTLHNFVLYVPAAFSSSIRLYGRNPASVEILHARDVENTIKKEISPKLRILHPIISAMNTQFPHPRLIQYDCGKLQTLDGLLRHLKKDGHRVLIFTQMTKMLDILEVFLNYHGYIYLRLDGSTRIEQRQIFMEQFNNDKRIFCFILSTRSGGVGINLTGADTVIFYDSDWNPTMDAQAQDRCHRIGQTRDVHIYRLISENTIEVNILKKANQKRMLCDMAIEDGNFTTSFFKSSTIKDLFNVEEPETTDKSEKCLVASSDTSNGTTSEDNGAQDIEKQTLRVYESALAEVEDELDVLATSTAKAEVAADLAEFDETIPIDEPNPENGNTEISKADAELQKIIKQLKPIERYAMKRVEEEGAEWTAQQLRVVEEEIEAQRREWETKELAQIQQDADEYQDEDDNSELLTYNQKADNKQVNCKRNSQTELQDTSYRPNEVTKTGLGLVTREKRCNKSKPIRGETTKIGLAAGKKRCNNKGYKTVIHRGTGAGAGERCYRTSDADGEFTRKSARLSVTAASNDNNDDIDPSEQSGGSLPRNVRSVSKELQRLNTSLIVKRPKAKSETTSRRLLLRVQKTAVGSGIKTTQNFNRMKYKKTITGNNNKKERKAGNKRCETKIKNTKSVSGSSSSSSTSSTDTEDNEDTSLHLTRSRRTYNNEQVQAVVLPDNSNALETSNLEQHSSCSGSKASPAAVTKSARFDESSAATSNRCTRSRGSVDINLWTLDESSVLPDIRHSTPKNQIRRENTLLKKLKVKIFDSSRSFLMKAKSMKHSVGGKSSSSLKNIEKTKQTKQIDKTQNNLLAWVNRGGPKKNVSNSSTELLLESST